MPACVTGSRLPSARSGRRELVQVDREPAEEDRREQDEQRDLDGLAIGVGQERHDDADPDRGDDEQREASEDDARPAQERHAEREHEDGQDGQRHDRAQERERGVLADQDVAAADGRDPEQVEHSAAPVVEHRQGADGDHGVLDDQREDHDPVEGDDVGLAGGEVDDVGPGGRGGDLGRDGDRLAGGRRLVWRPRSPPPG